ncbi:MAG: AAA family ATPase, partial [Gammaproteobacteria bacterium]|nr:AAA family ATPase [Gammaproteobacteria bacterium]
MLMNLRVRDFAIVDEIDIEFASGMSVLTGETGAGKSILVDALGLALGQRGSAQLVRDGAKRAEFAAEFDVSSLPSARQWLEAQALDLDDECLLRRVIGADGRSRAFVNGNAVPLSQLKGLGELMLDIHGQHFHQSLGHRAVQRDLLDHYGGLLADRTNTESMFDAWRSLDDKLRLLTEAEADRASRLDLLGFQLHELESLSLAGDEYEELHAERQKLMNSGRLADGVNVALAGLFDDDSANANSLLADALRSVETLADVDAELAPVVEMLSSAGIQVSEAVDELRRYGDSLDIA